MVVSISLSSGFSFQGVLNQVQQAFAQVSISLSSGFSFQVPRHRRRFMQVNQRFNLVIERLFISGMSCLSRSAISLCKFQSRYRAASHFRGSRRISRSDSIMFQSRYRAASHFRSPPHPTISSISSKFQSRYRAASHFRDGETPALSGVWIGFNLVIERLLISGMKSPNGATTQTHVSISLSSGFSFQASGDGSGLPSKRFVSISLSSGFSFQGHRAI